jgi:hypothetical protein
MDIRILRALLILAFFINITALFLTHFGMARFPCQPLNVLASNGWWCIEEANPIAKTMMFGGFWSHIGLSLVAWGLTFLWWERRVITKPPWNRFAWIPAFGMMFVLSIDLFNDYFVLANLLRIAV